MSRMTGNVHFKGYDQPNWTIKPHLSKHWAKLFKNSPRLKEHFWSTVVRRNHHCLCDFIYLFVQRKRWITSCISIALRVKSELKNREQLNSHPNSFSTFTDYLVFSTSKVNDNWEKSVEWTSRWAERKPNAIGSRCRHGPRRGNQLSPRMRHPIRVGTAGYWRIPVLRSLP